MAARPLRTATPTWTRTALPASAGDRKHVLGRPLRVQEFDKGRGPVGFLPIGQACDLPV